jgi:ABC-2 type transport system ATP-binding protein
MTERVIEIRGLRKTYGDVEAVKGIDLHVDRGEVFALLGPNGAGKTTTAEILEGFRPKTSGDVSVLGHDPARREVALKQRIAVLQSTGDPSSRKQTRPAQRYFPHPPTSTRRSISSG